MTKGNVNKVLEISFLLFGSVGVVFSFASIFNIPFFYSIVALVTIYSLLAKFIFDRKLILL